MFTHRHLDRKRPTVFDRHITSSQILPYSVLEGQAPSHKGQIPGLSISKLSIMQVGDYLVWVGRQSQIIEFDGAIPKSKSMLDQKSEPNSALNSDTSAKAVPVAVKLGDGVERVIQISIAKTGCVNMVNMYLPVEREHERAASKAWAPKYRKTVSKVDVSDEMRRI